MINLINKIGLFSEDFLETIDLKWVIGAIIIPTLVIVLSILISKYIKKRQRIKNNYKIIWRKSSKLKPKDLFNFTSYKINEFYYPRDYIDKFISENIENNKSFLIVGPPLSGKTRALYQNLRELKKNVDIIIPFKKDVDFCYDLIPKHYCFWRKRILLLDDLNIFASRKDFELLLDVFIKEGIKIIGSCRSNIELEKLKSQININSIFENNVIEIKKIEAYEALRITSNNLESSKVPDTFDGTIGSLVLPLDEMRIRYNNLDVKEKAILKALKLLMLFGLYNEKGFFKLNNGIIPYNTTNILYFANLLKFRLFVYISTSFTYIIKY